jgi:membrane protein implicated in regulation of membrane protease activity
MRADMVFWACAALVLMAIETFAPGAFMIWLGFAAAGTFLLAWLVPGMTVLWQVLAFVLLSFVSVGVYWKFFRRRESRTDQPTLNRRSEQLIGKVFPLETPIVNGQGRVRIGDALWPVEGPELPVGARVRVIGAENMVLKVGPVD